MYHEKQHELLLKSQKKTTKTVTTEQNTVFYKKVINKTTTENLVRNVIANKIIYNYHIKPTVSDTAYRNADIS